jgi:murein DD-endopeptidase MepM/ murein hydrolase activator NlpD
LLLLAVPAWAGTLDLEGDFVQGGLVHGLTDPGARAMFSEREVRVSESGRFIIGFGRDAPSESRLVVVFPDGAVERRRLRVAQRQYDIQRIDGLPSRMVSPPDGVLSRIEAENAMIARVRAVDRPVAYFESGFVWPLVATITGVYGSQRILNGEPRQPHYGIDIAAPNGTPVVAPADGVVALVHFDMYFTGGTIVIDHGHGLTSAFLHLKDLYVQPGQVVRQGEAIATVGATGRATGPHLDWRVNWFEERLDPALLVGSTAPGRAD